MIQFYAAVSGKVSLPLGHRYTSALKVPHLGGNARVRACVRGVSFARLVLHARGIRGTNVLPKLRETKRLYFSIAESECEGLGTPFGNGLCCGGLE